MNIRHRLKQLEQQQDKHMMYVALPIDYDNEGNYKVFEIGKSEHAIVMSSDELSTWEQQQNNVIMLKCVYQDTIGLFKHPNN